MLKRRILALGLAMLASFAAACGSDSKPLNIAPAPCSITANTTWTNDNLYVVGCAITIDATLTIEAGTIIKIARHDNGNPIGQPFITTGSDGVVKAVGTSHAHITFTSYADDSIGGNTDGITAQAVKGDWGQLFIGGQPASQFVYCDFLFGGHTGSLNPDDYSMLDIQFTTATIDHCTFAHSAHAALDLQEADDTTVVTNNIFYDNTKPLWMSPDFSLDNTNVFHNPDNEIEVNDYNGIWLQGSTSITKNRSWGNNDVPYVSGNGFSLSDPTADVPVILTVANGTVVKFIQSTARVDLGYDASIPNLNNAFFTSINDDEHGGDTNMDGSSTNPTDGDWQGIFSNTTADWVSSGGILYATHK